MNKIEYGKISKTMSFKNIYFQIDHASLKFLLKMFFKKCNNNFENENNIEYGQVFVQEKLKHRPKILKFIKTIAF